MDTNRLLELKRAAGKAAKRRRRNAELGGALVFAGLLLAAIYGLLTHQIHI
jgi:hypothetical protein